MTSRDILELLDFNKLLRIIAGYARSDASRRAVGKLRPLGSRDEIEDRFLITAEVMKLRREGDPLRLSEFPDITGLVDAARPEGAVLEAPDLVRFIPVFRTVLAVIEQINGRDDVPRLRQLTEGLTGHPEILRRLEQSIDSEGNILDTASFLLSDLRKQIRGLENRIRRKLEEIVRKEDVAVFLQDDFITQRAGRWVIPVRMDSKGMVEGVVHDVSKSGETAFVEPLAVISLVNRLENLIAEQKAEEIRILRELSSLVRTAADGILEDFRIMVHLDVLDCIARLSERLGMETPRLNDSGMIDIRQGRHPLLTLAHMRSEKGGEVVPLDVTLGDEAGVMVITGPNAGGKTVAIKTVGMLVLMAMAGMPIPAGPESNIPLVDGILADMGDEQSIEDNLSTFSAHISNLAAILQSAGPKSLVLIDELGTGTDPEEGAALACAVLREMKEKGALVFATTHLMGIKGFVQRTGGMINASMEFDDRTLRPLYRLRSGEPGRSHALEIARQYGLPDHVIRDAEELLGSGNMEFDNLISELSAKRSEYEALVRSLEERERKLEEKETLLAGRLDEAELKSKEILAQAYEEAEKMLSDLKREIHFVLDEIRKKEKSEIRRAAREVEKRQREVSEAAARYRPGNGEAPDIDDLAEGDTVFVKSLGYDARIVGRDARRGRVRVRAGAIEVEVPLSDIKPGRGITLEVTPDDRGAASAEEAVSSRLNVVGLRADDALAKIEPFLNRAMLGGLNEVTVIHGIGKGALFMVIRDYLQDHPLVKTFRPGSPPEGGEGVTVVKLV